MTPKIIIEVIPHRQQRYNTVGDWYWDSEGNLRINISSLNSSPMEMCVAIHELVEVTLCNARGISAQAVDEWDMGKGANLDEPGDDPRAPYYKEHMFASLVERLMVAELHLNSEAYDEAVLSVDTTEEFTPTEPPGVESPRSSTDSRANLSYLAVLTYSLDMSQWAYTTVDSRRVIEGHRYWGGINIPGKKGHIQPGDWVFVTHLQPSSPDKVSYSSIYVMGNEGRLGPVVCFPHLS